LFLTGPTGAGKSSLVEQMAARLGLGVIRVGCHNRMEVADFVGRYTLNSFGGMDYTPGPLLHAMKGGHILLIDEADLMPPAVAMGLNAVLDGAPLFIPETGERVQAAAGFRLVATGNTAGGGDASGLHRGTLRQNLAWMDRFITLKVGYMESAIEEALLLELIPELPIALISGLVKVANEIRNQFIGNGEDGGELDVTLSTRTLCTWASMASALASAGVAAPLKDALQVALLNRASPSVAAAIEGIAWRVMGSLYDPVHS